MRSEQPAHSGFTCVNVIPSLVRRRMDAGSIYALTATGVAVSRRNSGIIFCDANYAAILNRERGDVLGLSMEDVTHPDDTCSNAWLLQSAMNDGRAFDLRKRYVLPNGDIRWAENRVSTLGSGGDSLIVVLSRSVSAPKQPTADKSLREYLSDMSTQLASMAVNAGLVTTSEALAFASVLAPVEGE